MSRSGSRNIGVVVLASALTMAACGVEEPPPARDDAPALVDNTSAAALAVAVDRLQGLAADPIRAAALPAEDKASAALAEIEAPALSPEAQRALLASVTICANAHVQNVGWQGWFCASDGGIVAVGTAGQSLRMEALAVVTAGTGGICAEAHVQNVGWQGTVCGGDGTTVIVGTTGQSLQMEALVIGAAPFAGICGDAHVQNVGWQGLVCAGIGGAVGVGTVGQSLRMEAVALGVF